MHGDYPKKRPMPPPNNREPINDAMNNYENNDRLKMNGGGPNLDGGIRPPPNNIPPQMDGMPNQPPQHYHRQAPHHHQKERNNKHITSLRTLEQSTLPTILTMADLHAPEDNGRQQIAKDIESCRNNCRTIMSFAEDILILAESDFSFSAGLTEFMPEGCRMVATSFEPEAKLKEFHKEKLEEHLTVLKEANASVFHDVDAGDIFTTLNKSMDKNPEKRDAIKGYTGTYDIVWLQLPHTGGTCKTNSALLKRYLTSVGRVLKPNGMAYLTLYGLQVAHWKLPLHAEAGRMNPVMKIPFGTGVFPAIWTIYNPRVGFSDTYFDILRQPCDTFIFVQNEFTPVHNFSAVTQNTAKELAGMGVKTIADLSVLDRRLRSNNLDPALQHLIFQAKRWFREWMIKIPAQIEALDAVPKE